MTNYGYLPFEKLTAYQEARKLLNAVREASISDPRLRDQALRAATSTCLNISEGAGRRSSADKARVYAIARGEGCEAAAALDLALAAGLCQAARDHRTTMELDHFVLEVSDPAAAAKFFESTLGLKPVRLEEWQRGEVPFPSLRVSEGLIIDLFPRKMWRSETAQNPNHFCFNVAYRRFDEIGARVAIVKRDEHNYGARGYARSIYFDGPDGLSIEVRTYGGA